LAVRAEKQCDPGGDDSRWWSIGHPQGEEECRAVEGLLQGLSFRDWHIPLADGEPAAGSISAGGGTAWVKKGPDRKTRPALF